MAVQGDEDVKTLQSLSGEEGLVQFLTVLRDRFGLAHLVYQRDHATETAPQVVYVGSCASSWRKLYLERSYASVDPVLRQARKGVLPIDWSDAVAVTGDERDYALQRLAHGMGRWGCAIPIFAPGGVLSLITFTSNVVSRDDWVRLRRETLADMTLLAKHIHTASLSLPGEQTATRSLQLTRQARVCLELLAQGHSVNEIAYRLGLSVRTVRFHLDNARSSLRCQTKMEAAILAASMGLIRGQRQSV